MTCEGCKYDAMMKGDNFCSQCGKVNPRNVEAAVARKKPTNLEILGFIFVEILERGDVDLAWALGEEYTLWGKAAEAMHNLGYPDHAIEIIQKSREHFPGQN